MPAERPEIVGAYRIVGRIGRGAMGVVYRAVDTRKDREVALKVMLPDFASDENARSRFLREADAVSRLRHRNIVTVYECGVVDEAPYIAMELLKGASLAARLASTDHMRVDASLNILVQLCDGLQFAHDHGIVHRDVKPANVWLLDNGAVKLLDFGVAKTSGSTLTVSGGVVGSAAYMSPEQFGGGDVDGRSDVFSAGAVLYELLTRRRAFDGDSVTAVMHRILHEAPAPLASTAPDVPADVAHAVETALQKDPERRYANAADFGDDLRLANIALASATDATVMVRHKPAPAPVSGPVASRPSAVVPVPVRAPTAAPALSSAPLPPPAAAPPKRETPAPPTGESAADPPASLRWIQDNARMVAAGVAVLVLIGVVVALPRQPPAPPRPSFELQVQSTPPGAAIALDGRPTGQVTPATVSWQQRPSRVGLMLQGFETVDAAVPASPERPVLSYSLRRLLRVISEPAGAEVFVDGKNAGKTTPTEIAVEDPPPASIELRSGSFRRTIALSKQALDAGEIRVALATAAPRPAASPTPAVARTPVSVRVIGNFPFEVTGCDVSSPTATEHSLEVMAPCSLRLLAPSYFLDTSRTIEASSGRVEIVAPQLARVQLRSRYEQCTVILNGHAVGGPPVDLDLAAGTYTATIQCPDKRYTSRAFTIDPGRSTRRLDDELLP